MTEEQMKAIRAKEDLAFVAGLRAEIEYALSWQEYKSLPDGGRLAARAIALSQRRR